MLTNTDHKYLSRCGKGWRADSPVDMGGYTGADRCCRHHELWSMTLPVLYLYTFINIYSIFSIYDRCCRHHDLGCPLRWLSDDDVYSIEQVLPSLLSWYWIFLRWVSPVLPPVMNKYYPQYWTSGDKVGSDQCETARCDALLLWREVHLLFQSRMFVPFCDIWSI